MENLPIQQQLDLLERLEEMNKWTLLKEVKYSNDIKIANRYWNLGYKAKFKDINDKILKACDLESFIARAHLNLAEFFYVEQRMELSYRHILTAESILLKSTNIRDLSDALILKGQLQYHYGEYFLAENSATRALIACKKRNGLDGQKYKSLNLLGIVNMELDHYEKSLEFHLKALNFLEHRKLDSTAFFRETTLFNIGLVYHLKRNNVEATNYFSKVLTTYDLKNKNPSLYANVLDAMGMCKLESENIDQALPFFIKSQNINDNWRLVYRSIINDIHLSNFYLRKRDSASAEQYLRRGLYKCQSNNFPVVSTEVITELLKLAPTRHPLDVLGERLRDSIANRDQMAKRKFARLNYETIEALEDRNSAIKSKWIFITICGFLLIILGLTFVIVWQRTKQINMRLAQERYNSREKLYQFLLKQASAVENARLVEQNRIAKELHDGVMNKLLSVRLSLYVFCRDNNVRYNSLCFKQIDLIQSIELELRSLAHNLNNNELGQKGKFKELVQELVERYQLSTEIKFILDLDEKKLYWDGIDKRVKLNIYRILEETLSNAIKHSNCTFVQIQFNCIADVIKLEIADNGQGFAKGQSHRGMGLKNINDRLDQINGKFFIQSSPSNGTKLFIEIPI
ncbi:tetratricopeptide repeat-containing sensor histidine kinase [Flavobacterium selenitireducens]|uniref:tetratricopeptide repeat-containing sensor histidine kinase n=1 Tax=Flavobacterium selenitireducens TaxID=2722704 RepID=UPI00168A5AE1|nr:ATP-binding protein [Flavobacterium selenitireducens]MBD3582139.1 hypothetical protein [Flavobacterium selenitireducens]